MSAASQNVSAPAQSLNIVILAGAMLACCVCLWLASHSASPFVLVLAAIVFGFCNNTLFSLLHEAVHGMFHQNRTLNESAGYLAAAFFPTIFPIQRLSHLTHHKNNRSTVERFDFFEPEDNHLLKTAQWYSILTGLYWLFIPAFCSLYAITGDLIPWRKIVATEGRIGRQTSAKPYFDALQSIPMLQIRLGFVLTLGVQIGLFYALNLSLAGVVACYVAFGLMWSSLQYADHAFSGLDQMEGAWNLRVSPFTRALFLNYHYHLCHHRNITVPWRRLPATQQQNDSSFVFRRMLFFMWSGPRLLPGRVVPEPVQRRYDLTVNLFLSAIFFAIFAIIYTIGDHLYHSATHFYDFSAPLDGWIAFVPAAAAIYLCVSPMMMAAPLILRKPEQLLAFGAALLVELLIALALYATFQTSVPAISYSTAGLSGHLMALADWINLDGNSFPSLHVALAVSAAWAYAPFLPRSAAVFGWLLAMGIAAATLLTKQHVVADVLAGFALAAFGMGVIYPRASRELAQTRALLGLI